MSHIVPILAFEEGYKEKAYRDSEGYPTIGCGIKIGPKGAALENYTFILPRAVGDIWMQCMLNVNIAEMNQHPAMLAALRQCNPPRTDILYSMAYQMGVGGLATFKNTLLMIANGNFSGAAEAMLASQWARQTPARAQRQAATMRSGTYSEYQEVL